MRTKTVQIADKCSPHFPHSAGRSVESSATGSKRARPDVRSDDQENDRGDDESVDDEHRVRVAAHVVEQDPDRRQRRSRPPRSCRRRTGRPILAAGRSSATSFTPSKSDGAEVDGHEQEERDPRRSVAIEPQVARSGDDDARPRDTGRERERLCDAEEDSLAERQVAETGPWAAGRPRRGRRADGEEDRDLPGLAEMALDRAAQRGADDHGRDRGNDHDPGDALVDVRESPLRERCPPGAVRAPSELAPRSTRLLPRAFPDAARHRRSC